MHITSKSLMCFLCLFQSARSEGESSGEQSCESSDEGVGRDAPTQLQAHPQHPHLAVHQQLNLNHLPVNNHQVMNHQHQTPHARNSPRPHEQIKVRDDSYFQTKVQIRFFML